MKKSKKQIRKIYVGLHEKYLMCKVCVFLFLQTKVLRRIIWGKAHPQPIWKASTKEDLEERGWKHAWPTEGNWVERRRKICIPSHLEQRRKGDIIWRACSLEAKRLKRKSTSVRVSCAQIWGADEDCLCNTRRCWEKEEPGSHRNICSSMLLEK